MLLYSKLFLGLLRRSTLILCKVEGGKRVKTQFAWTRCAFDSHSEIIVKL